MNVIRPIRHSDFTALQEMAVESGVGFTSLPVNDDLLRSKITRSEQSFAKTVKQPGSEGYLMVLEEAHSGAILGTSAIEAAVGTDDAFYNYHLGKVVHASRELDVYNTVDILTLSNDYTGVSELCTLFLRENARKNGNGRLLSKIRFLFMMEHQQRFADDIIAEMRGVSDENGKSPFWAWLEEHFFSMDFPTADYLTGIGNKVFIAELMPKYPIYVSLLSKRAQAVIGKVHEKTKPALKLLEQEGFSSRGYVDIFDAGPTVEASLKHIRTAQASMRLPLKIDNQAAANGWQHLVINTSVQDFRGIMTTLAIDHQQQQVVLSQQAADALGVVNKDIVRFAPTQFKGQS